MENDIMTTKRIFWDQQHIDVEEEQLCVFRRIPLRIALKHHGLATNEIVVSGFAVSSLP
jgi:hypothetical protein